MPCSDGRDTHPHYSDAVRFCCEALSALEKTGQPIPSYMKAWWEDHKSWDTYMGRDHQPHSTLGV